MPGAFEFDGLTTERRPKAEVSHPHGGQRLRIAANGDVDAEPRVAQTQIRLGKYEPEVAQLLGGPAEAEMDHGAAGGQSVGLDGGSHPPHEQSGIGCLLEDRASQPALAPNTYLSDDRPELLPGGSQVVLATLAVRALSALHDSRTLELA